MPQCGSIYIIKDDLDSIVYNIVPFLLLMWTITLDIDCVSLSIIEVDLDCVSHSIIEVDLDCVSLSIIEVGP